MYLAFFFSYLELTLPELVEESPRLHLDRVSSCEVLYWTESTLNEYVVALGVSYRREAEPSVRINVRETTFPQMKGRTFETVRVIENLCEFCRRPVSVDETRAKVVTISTFNDHHGLVSRAAAHDRVEVDLEESRIYVYDHAYPCVFHPECLKGS